jgi:hypothetical protein
MIRLWMKLEVTGGRHSGGPLLFASCAAPGRKRPSVPRSYGDAGPLPDGRIFVFCVCRYADMVKMTYSSSMELMLAPTSSRRSVIQATKIGVTYFFGYM